MIGELAPELASNRFVQGFLVPRAQNLQELQEVEEEIRFERSSWQNSGAAEQYVDGVKTIFNQHNIPHALDTPKEYAHQLAWIRSMMYGTFEGSKRTLRFGDKTYNQLSPRIRVPMDELGNKAHEHSLQFRLAVADLTERKRLISQGLIGWWQEFTTQDLQNFTDFAQFLQGEDFEPLREQTRPFLETLQAKGGGFIDSTIRTLLENTVANPQPDLFAQVIDSLGQQNGAHNRHQILLQWLRLASFPSLEPDPEVIANKIKGGAPFPSNFRSSVLDFLQRRVKTDARVVNTHLTAFRPARMPTATLGINTFQIARGRERVVRVTQPTTKTEKGDVQTEAERPEFKLVLHDHGLLSGEDLDVFITKTANKFAPNDGRMRTDIQNILESLQADPFGFGVGKLTNMRITSADGSRSLPLRRFRADQRIPLEHELSRQIRVVYYLDRRGAPDTIILYQILDHSEFDEKYS